jgi:hypothetical protein
MPIIGFLALRSADEHIIALLVEAAEQAGDQDFLTGRDWRSEIERLVESSSARRAKDEKVVGLPTLREKFPVLADVLRALWPDPEIDLGDDGPPAGPGARNRRSKVAAEQDSVLSFPLETLPPVLRTLVEGGERSMVGPCDFLAIRCSSRPAPLSATR